MKPRSRDVLGRGGPFAQRLSQYEAREGQLAMAEAVEAALEQEHVLFCEAGTGTGKTFAYLVPAVLSGKKVVISTATRALQEQVMNHDVPAVERALGREVSAVSLKGLSNYLCLRRFSEFKSSPEAGAAKWTTRLRVLDEFRNHSSDGDIAELSALAEHDEILGHVVSSSDTRLGQRCQFHEQCFVTRKKRAAEAARIVVVNHHLFFADLALRGAHPGRVLPDYDAVIFDEAHQLEDVATLFFGVRVSKRRISSLTSEAERCFSDVPALALGSSRILRLVELRLDAFFDSVSDLVNEESRVRLSPETWNQRRHGRYLDLDTALETLESSATAAALEPTDNGARSDALDAVARRARTLRDALSEIVESAPGRVTWLEAEKGAIALSSSPVDLSGLLRQRVFDRVPSVTLTSATLATHGEEPFAFVRGRLGAVDCEAEVRELLVESPFDFRNSTRLYLGRRLPHPADPTFVPAACEEIVKLIEASDGGAFVLTTSLRAMREFYEVMKQRLEGRPLMMQGSAPKRALLSAFQSSERAVLVATMSFWEGVDVPGNALRLVILEKTPFSVPSDPLVEARARKIEEKGGNAFRELFLPSAQMMLKQGFGRLIRTQRDRGVVALLDSRVLQKGYGQALLGALPPARRLVDIEAACQFLRELRPASDDG